MNTFKVGQVVRHRHRSLYPSGTVKRVEEGCNAIYWVDFGCEFLTICTSLDITEEKEW